METLSVTGPKMKVNVFYCNTYAEVLQTAVCTNNFTLKNHYAFI